MTSFFSRIKGGAGPTSPATSQTPAKKDPNAPQLTPLEKLLADAGPVRDDGSDKFFGFENFGSTCYCNSIVQCLYYSVPFREQVINFPSRSPPEALQQSIQGALPRLNTDVTNISNGQNSALSPKGRNSFSNTPGASPRKSLAAPAGTTPPIMKPEDNKDSPEYKKKQAFAAGPVLKMDYENSKAYGMSESLFSALKDIFEAVIAHRSHLGVVSPYKFLEILRQENEMFRTPMHQDAHEFLNLLLNQVVENVESFSKSLVREPENAAALTNGGGETITSGAVVPAPSSTNTGWVHELFEGTLTSETRCLTCENTSHRDEAFLDLSVDLDQHSSVTSCLRKFSEEEMLCERNKFHCDNCGGLQEAEKRMKIKRLPRILALHLKRFKYTEDLQRLQKLFHRVVYPYYLRLFNTTDDAEDPDRLYELYAVVVHIGGGPYHGHYVSIIKTQERGWLLFDDEMVEPVDKAYVRRFFGGENELACAYVLFYQETTEEAMMKEQEAESLAAAKQASDAPLATEATSPKTNGAATSSHANTNGHPLMNATTPAAEQDEPFASLNHAATAPSAIPPPPSSEPVTALDHIATNLPKLGTRKSNLATSLGMLNPSSSSKKDKAERAKEEKERKAAEKELEKQAKIKRKEMETQRRENYRRQEEELRLALEASKATATEENRKRGMNDPEQQTDSGATESAIDEKDGHGNGSSGGKLNGFASLGSKSGGTLSRFRHTSMSLRHKPKFWSTSSSHEKEEMPPTPDHAEFGAVPLIDDAGKNGPAAGGGVSGGKNGAGAGVGAGKDGKEGKEDKKNRFSLGRKKSNFHL
ncbi:cysteine proteinase [Periconia macrospinosa]|uniref:Ubiquitin carboxyl-terminal hydrolase n=1 Tax=Periconia macrospinosa TaxID=97972 RepID=A0A2V1DM15_9PLEO|nr:cysteine proteinase [Periconia macrospinosa]